jgi:outer membrane biosynthesis protein TonB
MHTAGTTILRATVALVASTFVFAGVAEAKTREKQDKPAAEASEKSGERAPVAARGASRRVARTNQAPPEPPPPPPNHGAEANGIAGIEADVIANLDDLGQSSTFTRAEPKRSLTPRQARQARRAAERARRAARANEPGIDDLFRGQSRTGARPSYQEVGHVIEERRLSPHLLQPVIRAHAGEVETCFARSAGPNQSGQVTLSLVINPDGSVASFSAAATGADSARVNRCLRSRVMRWSFPSARGETRVDFPFVFEGK